MNAKSILISSIVLLVISSVFYLVYMNRASEKIVGAVIPITVAAVTAILLSIFFFGAEPPIEEVFTATFVYSVDTKMPPDLPWLLVSRRFIDAQYAPAALMKQRPDVFKTIDGDTLYHHLLQKSLIGWIGTVYRGSWQTEILRFETATGREMRFQPLQQSAPEPSKILTTADLAKLLTGNAFAGIETGVPPQIALPPNATLTLTPPTSDANNLEKGEILIRDRFCTFSISTTHSGGIRSIGAYKGMAGLSDADSQNLWTVRYLVRMRVEFSRWLSGNPEMPKYKKWTRQLVDGLKRQFDEEAIWRETRDDYRFMRETERKQP